MYINNNKGELTALMVQSIIESQKDEYTFLKTSILTKKDNLLIPYGNITDKYIDYMRDNSFDVKFSEEEKVIYKYNPKRLSFDVYNTTRLFFIILAVNNMASKLDFNRDRIFVPKPEALKYILEKIKIKDQEIIDNNREDIGL